MFITLRDKGDRKDTIQEVIARLRRVTASVPGINIYFQPIQSIILMLLHSAGRGCSG